VEKLSNLYSPDQRGMRWDGHVSHIREMRNAYKILVAKPERKRSLVRSTRKIRGKH
jgi:hypothetical protein